MNVASVVHAGGHAEARADRHAVDEDDSLISLPSLREIALGENLPRTVTGRHLKDHTPIGIIGRHDEHALAAVPIEGLDDDGAELLGEGTEVGLRLGDQ